MYIFISHSSKNADVAQELCNVIEANGSQCFIAPRNIRSGYEYAAEILNGIDRSDAMLLVLSKEINDSPHVLREIERAVSKSIPIIVYKLEDVTLSKSLEYFLMTHQWLNAEKGNHEHLLRCIVDLRDNTSTSTAVSVASVSPQATRKRSSKALPIALGIASTAVVTLLIILIVVLSGSNNDNNINNTTNNISSENIVADNTTNNDTEDTSKDKPQKTTTSDNQTTENTTDETTTENTTTNNGNTDSADVKLGDTIVLGKYNDAEIRWRVIKISDDGTEAVLIANNILSFKAYDGAESGKCGYDDDGNHYNSRDEEIYEDLELQAYVRGNSSWETSHIRAWLNSDDEVVTYDDLGPIPSALAEGKNSYGLEAGFLYYFTESELSAIKFTSVKTKDNAISEGTFTTTTDRVFLLSKDELEWIKDAKVSLYAEPTEEAIADNKTFFYRDYCLNTFHTTACVWWLREPLEGSSSECYLVSHGAKVGEDFYNAIVCVEDFGIRPAITVDLTSDIIKVVK